MALESLDASAVDPDLRMLALTARSYSAFASWLMRSLS